MDSSLNISKAIGQFGLQLMPTWGLLKAFTFGFDGVIGAARFVTALIMGRVSTVFHLATRMEQTLEVVSLSLLIRDWIRVFRSGATAS